MGADRRAGRGWTSRYNMQAACPRGRSGPLSGFRRARGPTRGTFACRASTLRASGRAAPFANLGGLKGLFTTHNGDFGLHSPFDGPQFSDLGRRAEGDGAPVTSGAGSAADAVHIVFRHVRQVIVI